MESTMEIHGISISVEQAENLRVADQVNKETLANPLSPYAGKFIGVWKGAVVVVGDTLDEVSVKLDELGDTRRQAVIREASADYTTPLWINPIRH